jgi:hypothetical protein
MINWVVIPVFVLLFGLLSLSRLIRDMSVENLDE